MNRLVLILLLSIYAVVHAKPVDAALAKMKVEISFPTSISTSPLTGRMFFIITRKNETEPRLQVGRYGTQFFGTDFEHLSAGKAVVIDGSTLGYPINAMADIPKGEYYIQAVLNKYTEFKRSDGYTVWMHMDQWEGQQWTRSPENVYSEVSKIIIDPSKDQTIKLVVNKIIPPIKLADDTKWVKRIKIKSEKLTKFWGHPIYIGATILLPKGYDENASKKYPTVYQQGHFSSGAPFRFTEDSKNAFYNAWTSDTLPRFIAITLQHPTPYFDDSYAVNTANNGPYGDAIHEELIPMIEKEFRCISEGYARLLTGGSTGGWESFALQVLYPEFYGGTWSFAPDPLDFRNVEGINIYEDKNAFYRQHEWYKAPIPNTRVAPTGEILLTSEQRNMMELVNGTKGRSGGQLDIWSAAFGPVGSDGYFKPLFDKKTGVMDSTVALYWKEHFDLRYYLEKNWATVGPKLVGKLNVFAGRVDDFYLNIGVYHLEEFLTKTTNPAFEGSFTYGDQGGHRWRPFSDAELLVIMDKHIQKSIKKNGHE